MINVILFGAGKNGKAALKKFGRLTGFFCDNNMNKVGQYIDGIEVISFDEMIRLHNEKKYIIVITPVNSKSMEMQLKDAGVSDYIVLQQYSDNVFEKADTYCTRPEIIDHNRMIDDLADDDSNKKLPLDVGDFISVVQKAMECSVSTNMTLSKYGFNEESMYYGNAYSIMRYAGIESDQIRYFPTVCHHSIFADCQKINDYRNAVIFQKDCFKRHENANVPYVPAFTVGAYINYAIPVYSDEKIKSLRDKYGPTLLASLPHSLEYAKRHFDKKSFINKLIAEFGNSFKTILLCVYFADLNESLFEYAEKVGVKIVTAGFRFDCLFDDRLRTLYELADAVAYCDITTQVAYAAFLNKNLYEIPDIRLDDTTHPDFGYSNYKYIDHISAAIKTMNNDQLHDLMWGDSECRSPEYIRNIHEISFDIWKRCEGMTEYYPEAVRAVCRQYYKFGDIEKYLMLKDAVGNFPM